ncbi:MAG: transglycosylase domain-containing protein [Cellulosilyticaceae bacterium]
MNNLFYTIVSISSTASFVALILILIRTLFKRYYPTIFSYLLWGILLFRLVTPISFSSDFSIFNWYPVPKEPLHTEALTAYVPTQPPITNPNITPQTLTATSPLLDPEAFALIWSVVSLTLILTCILLYLWTTRKFREAIIVDSTILSPEIHARLTDAHTKLYSIPELHTPIICGIIKPKIIIPAHMLSHDSSDMLQHVLSHELVHLYRKDHIIKLFSLIVACIHWFNPLVWICRHLALKDMEKSCDERVIQYACKTTRSHYAEALLQFSVQMSQPSHPLGVAFGESHIKSRIKGILNYKAPSFWKRAVAVCLVIIISGCMMTDASNKTLDVDLESLKNTYADQWVSLDAMSPHVIDATIASQDENFWQHNGVDPSALLRAALCNLRSGDLSEGGTTISEQVVRLTTLISASRPLQKKQIQMYSAIDMEKKYSKDMILESYLNTIHFGRGTTGIQAAAQYYFDKSPAALTREEAAKLVAIIDAPTHYDLISNTKNNTERARMILAKMP